MESKARYVSHSFSEDGQMLITFAFPKAFRNQLDKLINQELKLDIKQYRKHRSLSANAYAWVLIDKLAEKAGVSPEEIYRESVRNVCGTAIIVRVSSYEVAGYRARWQNFGVGWQTEVLAETEGYTDLICHSGSSVFDSMQMSQFIDNLVADCKLYGIETATPDELDRMVSIWGDKNGD